MAERAAVPDVETVRGWWQDLLNGVSTRDETHARTVPWLEGTEVVPDALVDAGLWDLHGANLVHAEDGGFRHGGAGVPARSLEDLHRQYESWSQSVRMRDEDPRTWAAMLLAQRREMKSYRDNLR